MLFRCLFVPPSMFVFETSCYSSYSAFFCSNAASESCQTVLGGNNYALLEN